MVKWTAKCFFKGVAINIAVWISWRLTPVQCPCTNLIIWRFKKDVLKNIAFDFMLLVSKWRLASNAPSNSLGRLVTAGKSVNSYFTFTVDKTHHGPVIAPFSMQLLQLFLYVRGVSATNLSYCCLWYAFIVSSRVGALPFSEGTLLSGYPLFLKQILKVTPLLLTAIQIGARKL